MIELILLLGSIVFGGMAITWKFEHRPEYIREKILLILAIMRNRKK